MFLVLGKKDDINAILGVFKTSQEASTFSGIDAMEFENEEVEYEIIELSEEHKQHEILLIQGC
jgi:hypothetical protein